VPSPIDPPFRQALTSLERIVPQSIRGDFRATIDNVVRARATPAQTLTPAVAKEIESELGRLAAGYRGSSVQSERLMGQALAQARNEVRALVERHNPVTAPQLRAIDSGWANLTQIENAGAMLGAKEGVISPAQFLNAVKKSDKSLRDRAFAGGTARNQELAQAADAVLSSRYPDSGTAGRAMIGAVGAGGLGYINPAIPIGAAAATLPYSPIGQRLTAAALTQRPQASQDAGEILKRLAPWLAAGGHGLLSAL
jgi:hypothetical protein